MSRPFRIEAANNFYYVRNFGRKGVGVFKNESDLTVFSQLLLECCKRFGIHCYSYTFLSSEFHLLLRTSQENLALFMRQLSGVYTQGYNRRYQLNGSLFKGRYQSSLLDPDHYPLRLSLHIHHLYLTNNSAHSITRSSCNDYLHPNKNTSTISPKVIVQQLEENHPNLTYQELLQLPMPKIIQGVLNRNYLPPIIGSSAFKTEYESMLLSSPEECAVSAHMKINQHIKDIVACTASAFKLPTTRLLQAQYGHNKSSDARNMAMYLCQQHTNMTLKEIAKAFSISHYASVSNRISHFKKILKIQSSLQRHVEQVNQKLLNKIILEQK